MEEKKYYKEDGHQEKRDIKLVEKKSKVEIFSTYAAIFIMIVSILWTLKIAPVLRISIYKEQYLAFFLAFSLIIIFFKKPFKEKSKPGGIGNVFLGIIAFTSVLYFAFNYANIQLEFAYGGPKLIILSAIIFISVLEALRRTTGYVIFSIVSFFLLFALVAHKIPMPLTGRENTLTKLVTYLVFDPGSILGMPLSVIASTVVVFIFYGYILVMIGGGDFFIDLAMSGVGNKRGGAAKIAIVASALMGSISGSAVSNVASTGIMTIPLMKKAGFKPKTAAAIEAVASTGGQITPPIMGAAAFIMASFLQVDYQKIVIASIVPAALYYFSIFIQIDLMSIKDKIVSDFVDIPEFREVLKNGWQIFIPFIVLFGGLFHPKITPEIAALYSSVTLIVIGVIKPYKQEKLNFKKLVYTFSSTIFSMLDLIPIVAAAGIIIGILNISGGGFTISIALAHIANGNLWITLIISAALSIFLGMGMPTSGVYVLLSALLGPTIVQAGVNPIAAHMFIFYFGMMSMITPPIALASFTASTISGSKPLETGLESMKLGWIAYVVPILFFFSPTLLMIGEPAVILIDVLTVTLGVYSISVAFVGYYDKMLSIIERIMFAISGAVLLIPLESLNMNYIIPIAFAVINILLLVVLKFKKRYVNVVIR